MQSDTIIVVGAASRGIIQRGHENTAAMYKTYYAPNPFDNITEEDVEEYKEEIERKTRGDGICGTHFVSPVSCLSFKLSLYCLYSSEVITSYSCIVERFVQCAFYYYDIIRSWWSCHIL